MPGNTFEFAETPDGKTAVHCGTLHMLDEGDRNGSADLNVNPGFAAWVECNLSGRVPPGTTALYGYLEIGLADTTGTICIRDGAGAETNVYRTRTLRLTALANYMAGSPCIIKATNGIFDYIEESADTEISTLKFILWGYFI